MTESNDRNRPRHTVTLARDLSAYLEQEHINKSRQLEVALRNQIDDDAIRTAAQAAGMTEEEILEARYS